MLGTLCSNDFRPDYKKLGILKQQFPDTPILALTATATHQVPGCCTMSVQRLLPDAPHSAIGATSLAGTSSKRVSSSISTQVCQEVRSILHIEASELFRSSINRPNLYYEVGLLEGCCLLGL